MKLMFASDLHGSAFYTRTLLRCFDNERADKLILLGDLLYHGPRNDLPQGYNPKTVTTLLNDRKHDILCVRGNCDADVDLMVLEFPVGAQYLPLFLDGHTVFVTHGDLYNEENLPPLQKGDVLMHGHTHVRAMEDREDYFFLNPGSISLPKGDGVRGYLVYEDGVFTAKDLEGNVLESLSLAE